MDDVFTYYSHWYDEENSERYTCEEIYRIAENLIKKLKMILDTVQQNKSHGVISHVDKQVRNEQYVTEIMQVMTELRYCDELMKRKLNTSKELLCEKQLEVNKLYIRHRNDLKENDYLRNEIDKCLEFKSDAQNMELLPLEEFLENAPTELTEEKSEEHLYMNRLRWELSDRQRLVKDLQELQLQKEKLKKQIKMFRNYFKSFDIDKLMEAASPLQSKLGLPLKVMPIKQNISDYLPLPLYYLYSQMATYSETYDKDLEYSIVGDVEAAKDFQKKLEYNIIAKKAMKYDTATETLQPSDTIYNVKVVYGDKDMLAPHPLAVHVLITESDIQVILKFSFLYHLNIATVNVEVSLPNIPSIHNEVFASKEFLRCLFPNDNGLHPARAAISLLLLKHGYNENDGQIISHDIVVGWPYRWVQKLTGLHFFVSEELPKNCTVSTGPEKTLFVEQTLLAIKQRIITKVILYKQLISLANKTLPETPVKYLCPSNITSKIESWSVASWEEIESHPNYEQMCEDNIQPPVLTVYKACIKSDSVDFIAYVILRSDYPVTWPLFLLEYSSNSQQMNAGIDLKEVEEAINIKCLKRLPKEHHVYMLTWQLHHLLSMH